eukprot:symbB.v1.2.018372.t1/scaffold1462.1/size117239/5
MLFIRPLQRAGGVRWLARAGKQASTAAHEHVPPFGWQVCHSEKYDRPYYWNLETGTAQWEVPLEAVTLPKDWRAVYSEAHGKHYYWDLRSGATQWEKPKATAKKAGNDADLKVQDAALPNGWEAVWHEEANKYYYWLEAQHPRLAAVRLFADCFTRHISSGKTTWDLPMVETGAAVEKETAQKHRASAKDASPDDGPLNRWRDVLHSAQLGQELHGDDLELVKALLAYHPAAKEKIGVGLQGIKVDRAPANHGRQSRCFWVVRTDGSEEDFSARKCLKAMHQGSE